MIIWCLGIKVKMHLASQALFMCVLFLCIIG